MPKATDIPARTRQAAYERDGHRCRWCGRSNGGLHLHHIVYRSTERNNHDLSNLITLCPSHHSLVHTDKGLYQSLLTQLLGAGNAVTGMQLMRWQRSGG